MVGGGVLLGQEKDSVEHYVNGARAALLERHYSDAIRLLEKGLLQFPNDNRLRVELGRAYLLQGETGRAIHILREVQQVDPTNRSAKLELARALAYRRQYKASDQLYREILEANPGDEPASIGLVGNLMHERLTGEARTEVGKGLARHPNSLRLQEYQDRLEKGELGGDEEVSRRLPNQMQAEADHIADSDGNRVWSSDQRLNYEIRQGIANKFQMEERRLSKIGGTRAAVGSGSDMLRMRLAEGVYLDAGGGAVRFDDGVTRTLYQGGVEFYPAKHLLLEASFSRAPFYPTARAAGYDLVKEGVQSYLGWQPGGWSLSASWSKHHFSDSNRVHREDFDVLRWLGSPRFALGAGYRFTGFRYSQDLTHGYFDPDFYRSHLGVAGLRFQAKRMFRAEYLARAGGESISHGPYQTAWEISLRHEIVWRNWEASADYFYFHLAQPSGAFRAQAGRVALNCRF